MDRKEARRKAQELVMKMTIEEKASQLKGVVDVRLFIVGSAFGHQTIQLVE